MTSLDYPASDILDEGIVFYSDNAAWAKKPKHFRLPGFDRLSFAAKKQLTEVESADPGSIDVCYPNTGLDNGIVFHHNASFRMQHATLKLPGIENGGEQEEDSRKFEKTGCLWKQVQTSHVCD